VLSLFSAHTTHHTPSHLERSHGISLFDKNDHASRNRSRSAGYKAAAGCNSKSCAATFAPAALTPNQLVPNRSRQLKSTPGRLHVIASELEKLPRSSGRWTTALSSKLQECSNAPNEAASLKDEYSAPNTCCSGCRIEKQKPRNLLLRLFASTAGHLLKAASQIRGSARF